MTKINSNLLKISRKYIFPVIEEKIKNLKYREKDADIINMGIGDVSLPLAPTVAKAIKDSVSEMEVTPYGYGPAEGYPFLRDKIVEMEYKSYKITADEIFISEGINLALCQMEELFSLDQKVAITDPTYPVYFDSNIMSGRTSITLLPCVEEHNFFPCVPKNEHFDIIYLCSPNNPTGVAMTRAQLQKWVDYALDHNAIIFFDAAYEAFITSEDVPKSIYEIENAEKVAVEFRSFSKSAGFTGLRLGYTIVPKSIMLTFEDQKIPLNNYWKIRQNTKNNGISYPIQKGGLASLYGDGLKETTAQTQHYLTQAKKLKQALIDSGFTCYGGIDSPYIWWKIPPSTTSWEFFDYLLNTLKIVSIPGSGFGKSGEGFVRLSAFVLHTLNEKAISRIQGIPCNMK